MKLNAPPYFWLLLGLVLTASIHTTYGIGFLAWIAFVPFLIYLHQTKGWKSRLWFVLTYLLVWHIGVYKITTEPLPLAMIPMFAVPIAVIHLPAFLIWARFRHRKGALFLFPVLMVLLEWLQYTFTPFSSWGVAAYTQMDNIQLMQTVSLFGLAGLGFLIYWVNAAFVYFLTDLKIHSRSIISLSITLLFAICFGATRYNLDKADSHENTLSVAAVGTNSEVGAVEMPTPEVRKKNAAILFERTRKAANAGAQMIVWNEAAAAVFPNEESEWINSLRQLASETKTTLVAAYVVPISETPLHYENKYLFIQADGSVASTYFKHEPVPGEPAVKGTAPFSVHQLGDSRIAGAICYDYDFPYIAKAHGKLKADLIALPSSDWRGIDPIHTKMAAFRAVEQGVSIVRSTRFGLSGAITPYGEMVAQMSSFDKNDRILLAQLPSQRVFSLYRVIGDSFIYACLLFLFWFLLKRIGILPSKEEPLKKQSQQ
jgi:apolipoprotein N-acyltransferase